METLRSQRRLVPVCFLLAIALCCLTRNHAFAPTNTLSKTYSVTKHPHQNKRSFFSKLTNDDNNAKSEVTNDGNGERKIESIGIGGTGGFQYDVNRLKRNLVQETVQAYKKELMELLGTPLSSEKAIEDKLAALVQANPVSCTTDSNLLDGMMWSYAFGSYKTASDVLLDSSRFLYTKRNASKKQQAAIQLLQGRNKSKVQPTPLRLRPGTAESPFRSTTRQFYLEDLYEDEDPYVVDQTSFLGGLFSKNRRYSIVGLTRTSLELDISESRFKLLGNPFWGRNYRRAQRNPCELQVLYLDGDLCVTTSLSAGLGGPFHVYTKSDQWGKERTKRKARFSLAVFNVFAKYVMNVVQARQRLWKLVRAQREEEKNDDSSFQDKIQFEKQLDDSTTLKVTKLGALEDDDEAWDGEDDPFVHLSADERQEMLRTLTVKDIDTEKQRQDRKKKKQKKRPLRFQRKKPFTGPEKG